MTSAGRPSGPAKPTHERRDAVAEQEGLDEAAAERSADESVLDDSRRHARQAERAAHVAHGKRSVSGSGTKPL
jgi:hypothetical protein